MSPLTVKVIFPLSMFPDSSILVKVPIGAERSNAFPTSQGFPPFFAAACKSLLVISSPTAKPYICLYASASEIFEPPLLSAITSSNS